MKLAKNVLLESVEICDTTGAVEVWLCLNINRENSSCFYSFNPDLNCNKFKEFCKILGTTQKKTREIISEQLP